jgi:hypothetical protein
MMEKRFLFFISMLISIGFVDNGLTVSSQAQLSDGQHLILSVKGSVGVKKAGRSKDVSAFLGMSIKNGDVLTVGKEAIATILCADGTLLNVASSPYAVQCGANKRDNKPHIGIYKGSEMSEVRGGSVSDDFPIVISPRRTKLLNAHPKIRWTSVKPDSKYNVKVMRGTQIVWEQVVSNATEVAYPDTPKKVQPLQPGVTYRVIVTVGDRSSTEEKPGINLGFSVLRKREAEDVRKAEQELRDLGLSVEATRFLIANLYATWGLDPNKPRDDKWALNAEAIQELESLPNTQEPALPRILGDLYLALDLSYLAENHYTRALKLSEDQKDVEGQALSQRALGKVFKVRFNKDEAKRRLSLAKQLYESIGDLSLAQEINHELAELR